MKKASIQPTVGETFHYTPSDQAHKTEGLKRAAAYCRVSTLSEEQELSFDSQVSYYTDMIGRDPSLILVGIYGDHGFSGLNMTKRNEFQRMLDDCEAGRIDVIYVKSVSRFSRNAADALSVLKRLNTLGIRVLFEKEGLDSANPATEMVLNIYATMAQNESCSQSENMRWAQDQRAKMGNPIRGACFGYRIEKKKGDAFRYWVICEKEAEIVRQIFSLAHQGYTIGEISQTTGFSYQRLHSLLRNEAYKGDILTNKTITLDYTSQRTIRNRGQRDQVYIEGHHEGIIDPAVFDEVQTYLDGNYLNSVCLAKRKAWFAEHPEILQRRTVGATD